MANTKKLVSIWAAVFITIYLFSVIYFNSTIEQRVVYVEDKPSTNRLLETTNLYDDYDPAIDIITPWKPNELNSLSAEEPQDHDPQHELPAHPVPQKNNNHQSGENTVQQFGSEVSYTADKDVEWLFEIPPGVPPEHQWRYKSNNVYWSKNDTLYRKFEHYKENLELPPKSVQGEITRVCSVLKSKGRDYLCEMFTKCFPNTLSTTTSLLHDNTVYVITGDIPLMWMRDSAAQVQQYIPLLKSDPEIQILIEGVIRRQIRWISLDVYGSSYRLKLDFDNVGKKALTEWDFQCGRTIHVAQHDYEIDSLCYFIRLSYNYYQEMQECLLFDDEWLTAAKSIVDLWILEQNHNEKSSYTYPILANGGIGTRTCYTGMTWGGSRPSDDPCKYHYLIPANMFAVVALRHLQDILKSCYPQETEFAAIAHKLELEIDEGIHTYGVKDLNGKKSYVYEASGCGEQLFMDDANVPSLLAMDYLGYTSPHDPDESIKRHTIQSILSPANPYFFEGPVITGIGSPHTTNGNVWPMSVIIQAMISNDKSEINRLINMLERSDGNTGFMHESVSKSNGKSYTRPWFAWANSLFSELIYTYLDDIEPK